MWQRRFVSYWPVAETIGLILIGPVAGEDWPHIGPVAGDDWPHIGPVAETTCLILAMWQR